MKGHAAQHEILCHRHSKAHALARRLTHHARRRPNRHAEALGLGLGHDRHPGARIQKIRGGQPVDRQGSAEVIGLFVRQRHARRLATDLIRQAPELLDVGSLLPNVFTVWKVTRPLIEIGDQPAVLTGPQVDSREQLVRAARRLRRRLRPEDVQQQTFTDGRLVARIGHRGSKQRRSGRRRNGPRIQPTTAIVEGLGIRNDFRRPAAARHGEGQDEHGPKRAHSRRPRKFRQHEAQMGRPVMSAQWC